MAEIELERRREWLREMGRHVEERIGRNESMYVSVAEAKTAKEFLAGAVKWEVFRNGCELNNGDEMVEIKPEMAEAGESVLNARALLVLGAIGKEKFMEVMGKAVGGMLEVRGGGVWQGAERKLDGDGVADVVRNFMDESCDLAKFRFVSGVLRGQGGSEIEREERTKIGHRVEAAVNGIYYMLATMALVDDRVDQFEEVQQDWLLSGNIRFPVLKGIERSKPREERRMVQGFAQMAPIRHLSPGSLATILGGLS